MPCRRAVAAALVVVGLSGCGENAATRGSGESPETSTTVVITSGPSTRASPVPTTFVPNLLALDWMGHLYFSDCDGGRVYRLNGSGEISVVAGDGTQGSSGDGGPATQAELACPAGLAFDGGATSSS